MWAKTSFIKAFLPVVIPFYVFSIYFMLKPLFSYIFNLSTFYVLTNKFAFIYYRLPLKQKKIFSIDKYVSSKSIDRSKDIGSIFFGEETKRNKHYVITEKVGFYKTYYFKEALKLIKN